MTHASEDAHAGTDAREQEIEALLNAAAHGDEGAWRRLVGLYAKRVAAFCRSRLRDGHVAEEVTQSVFVTVATKLKDGGYQEHGRFEAWLMRITINRIRDEVRRVSRKIVVSDSEAVQGAAARMPRRATGDGRDSDRDESMRALREAMERLPEADRHIIELRHHAAMSFAAIAELLGEPLGTLLARHHRAIKKLRGLIDESGGGRVERAS
ncbi:MAG: sigma-70 family RNA polymerase sigma factor [Phycisphaerales bacterium]|nr:sigma-70 family RNA polymerase sigma factor [Phycisphaerales bacterium]